MDHILVGSADGGERSRTMPGRGGGNSDGSGPGGGVPGVGAGGRGASRLERPMLSRPRSVNSR